jgi:GT2 family glycosyltransferase
MHGSNLIAGDIRIAVGIATSGRRDMLAKALEILSRQTCLPDAVVICPISSKDVDHEVLSQFPAPTQVVVGPVGLPAQRNRLIAAAADADVIVFFDDDFFAERNYLAVLKSIFLANPDVVGVTGDLIVDGAPGPGLSMREGVEILEAYAHLQREPDLVNCYGTYGCNMAFRMDVIKRNSVRFDENLPLYGWQEDIDFSRRMVRYGRVVRSTNLRGVHLGVKSGKTSGVRLGYSQVANLVYLYRKGSVPRDQAMTMMRRNLLANFLRTFHPEPWVDRKGRLKGNVMALVDWCTGRISPLRILQLK